MKLTENQMQEKLADSRYVDIGPLPSQCFGYDWKRLYIRPFTPQDFTLVSKAAVLNDMDYMLRAIDMCITQEAAELTIGDLYYVMLWLRIHSLPKTPVVVNWDCTAKVLRHKETQQLIHNGPTFAEPENREDYEVIDCERSNSESIHMAKVNIISLDDETQTGEVPEGFDWPRAKHIQEIREALKDPGLQLMVPNVQWIAGKTLKEKFDTLFNSPDGIDMLDTGHVLREKYEHGVHEVTKLHCSNCRAEVDYVINVNPMSFFP